MFVRTQAEVDVVLALAAEGQTSAAIARRTGIPRSTVRDWRAGLLPQRDRPRPCPICAPGSVELPPREYVYLLGLYLGDGYISRGARTYCLRFFLDGAYPGIIRECRESLEAIRPTQRAWDRRTSSSRCHVVAMYSNHWPCLFPQHGAGRKHERQIALARWQADLVAGDHA
jgi:Homeodomain-like domain